MARRSNNSTHSGFALNSENAEKSKRGDKIDAVAQTDHTVTQVEPVEEEPVEDQGPQPANSMTNEHLLIPALALERPDRDEKSAGDVTHLVLLDGFGRPTVFEIEEGGGSVVVLTRAVAKTDMFGHLSFAGAGAKPRAVRVADLEHLADADERN